MRRHALSISLVVVAFSGPAAPVAWSQAQELAVRGPRFIAAWKPAVGGVDASNAVVLRRRVSLDLTNVTADEALKEITRQADLEISYSKVILPRTRSVSLHVREITVAAALTEVLLDAGVDVAVAKGGQIALVKRVVPAMETPVADTGTVTGLVTDKKTGAPLYGATVAIEGTALSTTTDSEGRYRLVNVTAGTHTLRIRSIGYAPATAMVTVVGQGDVTADVALDKSVQKLDELVTVTPGGMQTEVKALPSPITVITAEDIELQQPQIINDLLRQSVPGLVSIKNPSDPGATPVSMRGSSTLAGVPQVKTMVDGIEVVNFSSNPVDPASIERVEVIRGPQAATLYGADAAGGVIQIFTKRGSQSQGTRIHAQAQTGVTQTPYDGFRTVPRQRLDLSGYGGTGDFSYNFGGGYTHLSSWLPADDLSRQRTPSVYAGMRYAHGILSADLSARYLMTSSGSNFGPQVYSVGLDFLSRPLFTQVDNTNTTYGARVMVAPVSWFRNQFTLGFDGRSSTSRQLQRRLTTPADTLFNVSEVGQRKISIGYNASIEGVLDAALSGAVVAGIDHFSRRDQIFSAFGALNTEGTVQVSPDGASTQSLQTVTNTGYFAEGRLSVADALFVTGGLRVEDNSTFGADIGTVVQPRVGFSAVRQFGEVTVKARAAYGRAIRAPGAGLATGSVQSTFITLPNPQLGPERQRGWDGGVDLMFGESALLSITGYDQVAEDLVATVFVTAAPLPTFQNVNLGRVKNRGVELEGRVAFGSLEIRAQYAFTRARVDDLGPAGENDAYRVGDQVTNTPKQTAGASLTFLPQKGTAVTAGMTYVGGFRALDALALFGCLAGTAPCPGLGTTRDFTTNYPGFVKLNATLTQRLGAHLDGTLSIDNLTNKMAFEDGNTSPVIGRTTMIGLRLRH